MSKRRFGTLTSWFASEHGGYGYVDTANGNRYFLHRRFIRSGDPRPGSSIVFTTLPPATDVAKYPRAIDATINANTPAARETEIERLLARKKTRKNGYQVSVKSPSILKAPQNDEARHAAIRDLVNEISVDHICPWCGAKFDVRTAAENHFQDEYAQGKRQSDHVKTLRASDLVSAEILEEAERRLTEHTHFLEINERVQRLRKRRAEWQREGKRELDKSKTYISWDLRIW